VCCGTGGRHGSTAPGGLPARRRPRRRCCARAAWSGPGAGRARSRRPGTHAAAAPPPPPAAPAPRPQRRACSCARARRTALGACPHSQPAQPLTACRAQGAHARGAALFGAAAKPSCSAPGPPERAARRRARGTKCGRAGARLRISQSLNFFIMQYSGVKRSGGLATWKSCFSTKANASGLKNSLSWMASHASTCLFHFPAGVRAACLSTALTGARRVSRGEKAAGYECASGHVVMRQINFAGNPSCVACYNAVQSSLHLAG